MSAKAASPKLGKSSRGSTGGEPAARLYAQLYSRMPWGEADEQSMARLFSEGELDAVMDANRLSTEKKAKLTKIRELLPLLRRKRLLAPGKQPPPPPPRLDETSPASGVDRKARRKDSDEGEGERSVVRKRPSRASQRAGQGDAEEHDGEEEDNDEQEQEEEEEAEEAEEEEPRVEMWNTRSHKRLVGQNRPFRRDVNDFMRRRPEYVLYTGQDREPKRPAPKPPKKRKKNPQPADGFAVGKMIEAEDQGKTGWYPAKILERSEVGVKIHYMGWKAVFDEIIPLVSGRLRLLDQDDDSNSEEESDDSSGDESDEESEPEQGRDDDAQPAAASKAVEADAAASDPDEADGLSVGAMIEVQDKAKTGWYSAKVLERSREGIKIHYMGWKAVFDEVISLDEAHPHGRLRLVEGSDDNNDDDDDDHQEDEQEEQEEQEEDSDEEESESDAEDIPVAASQPSPSDGFGVGELIEVQDKAKTGWYSAKILERSAEGVKIHYVGWKAVFDEVIPLGSGRLRREGQGSDDDSDESDESEEEEEEEDELNEEDKKFLKDLESGALENGHRGLGYGIPWTAEEDAQVVDFVERQKPRMSKGNHEKDKEWRPLVLALRRRTVNACRQRYYTVKKVQQDAELKEMRRPSQRRSDAQAGKESRQEEEKDRQPAWRWDDARDAELVALLRKTFPSFPATSGVPGGWEQIAAGVSTKRSVSALQQRWFKIKHKWTDMADGEHKPPSSESEPDDSEDSEDEDAEAEAHASDSDSEEDAWEPTAAEEEEGKREYARLQREHPERCGPKTSFPAWDSLAKADVQELFSHQELKDFVYTRQNASKAQLTDMLLQQLALAPGGPRRPPPRDSRERGGASEEADGQGEKEEEPASRPAAAATVSGRGRVSKPPAFYSPPVEAERSNERKRPAAAGEWEALGEQLRAVDAQIAALQKQRAAILQKRAELGASRSSGRRAQEQPPVAGRGATAASDRSEESPKRRRVSAQAQQEQTKTVRTKMIPWSAAEDAELKELVDREGEGCWQAKVEALSTARSKDSIRQRWHFLKQEQQKQKQKQQQQQQQQQQEQSEPEKGQAETDGNAAVEATSREGMSELRGDSKSEQELSSPDSPSLCDERAASLGVWASVACNPTTEALTPEVVSQLLSDSDFCPGARPVCFAAGEHTSWIFKEGPRRVYRGADRWHNSGGAKAARLLPQENPVVCRRFGSLAQQNGQKFRYHEYCLVTPTDQNDYIEERGVTLFHLMQLGAEEPKAGAAEPQSSTMSTERAPADSQPPKRRRVSAEEQQDGQKDEGGSSPADDGAAAAESSSQRPRRAKAGVAKPKLDPSSTGPRPTPGRNYGLTGEAWWTKARRKERNRDAAKGAAAGRPAPTQRKTRETAGEVPLERQGSAPAKSAAEPREPGIILNPPAAQSLRELLSTYRKGGSSPAATAALRSRMEADGWTTEEKGGHTLYFPPGVTKENGYRCDSSLERDGTNCGYGQHVHAYYQSFGPAVRHLRKAHGVSEAAFTPAAAPTEGGAAQQRAATAPGSQLGISQWVPSMQRQAKAQAQAPARPAVVMQPTIQSMQQQAALVMGLGFGGGSAPRVARTAGGMLWGRREDGAAGTQAAAAAAAASAAVQAQRQAAARAHAMATQAAAVQAQAQAQAQAALREEARVRAEVEARRAAQAQPPTQAAAPAATAVAHIAATRRTGAEAAETTTSARAATAAAGPGKALDAGAWMGPASFV